MKLLYLKIECDGTTIREYLIGKYVGGSGSGLFNSSLEGLVSTESESS
jgi:hypothetical protein